MQLYYTVIMYVTSKITGNVHKNEFIVLLNPDNIPVIEILLHCVCANEYVKCFIEQGVEDLNKGKIYNLRTFAVKLNILLQSNGLFTSTNFLSISE